MNKTIREFQRSFCSLRKEKIEVTVRGEVVGHWNPLKESDLGKEDKKKDKKSDLDELRGLQDKILAGGTTSDCKEELEQIVSDELFKLDECAECIERPIYKGWVEGGDIKYFCKKHGKGLPGLIKL